MLLSWWAGRLVLIPGTLQRETNFNHFNFNETNFATLRCDCSLVSCYCCGGYDVQLNFASLSSLDLSSSVKFLSNACSGTILRIDQQQQRQETWYDSIM